MFRPAHPQRVFDLVARLQAYFDDDDDLEPGAVVVSTRMQGHAGIYVTVSRSVEPGKGIIFHPDELDNGGSGWKLPALERIRAYLAQVDYQPAQIPARLVYDDVMALSNGAAVPGEVDL